VDRILVIRGGAIGDFLLTVPALQAVRSAWPRAHLALLGNPAVADLARAAGLADEFRSVDRADVVSLFATGQELDSGIRFWVGSFDLIVSYLHDPDGVVENHLHAARTGRLVCASPLVSAGHAVEHFLRPLGSLGLRVGDVEWQPLALPASSAARGRERVAALGDRVLALHPGSGGRRKNWPLHSFLELAATVERDDRTAPLFVLGEAEHAVRAELEALAGRGRVLADRPLLEVAEATSACAAFVGNDSGITHLAACLGRPTVAVFGPTDPAVWGPRGPRVRIVQASDRSPVTLGALPVARVLDALRQVMDAKS
jgi:heptosyltransferase-2